MVCYAAKQAVVRGSPSCSASFLSMKLPASLSMGTAPILSQKPELDLSIAGHRAGKPAVAMRGSQMVDNAHLKLQSEEASMFQSG